MKSSRAAEAFLHVIEERLFYWCSGTQPEESSATSCRESEESSASPPAQTTVARLSVTAIALIPKRVVILGESRIQVFVPVGVNGWLLPRRNSGFPRCGSRWMAVEISVA
jgi:hypothetical protein